MRIECPCFILLVHIVTIATTIVITIHNHQTISSTRMRRDITIQQT